jgi:uncharacterized membrane protein YidH (DUF202 family)
MIPAGIRDVFSGSTPTPGKPEEPATENKEEKEQSTKIVFIVIGFGLLILIALILYVKLNWSLWTNWQRTGYVSLMVIWVGLVVIISIAIA